MWTLTISTMSPHIIDVSCNFAQNKYKIFFKYRLKKKEILGISMNEEKKKKNFNKLLFIQYDSTEDYTQDNT